MFAPTAPPEGWLRLLPSVCFVTLLTLGQMLLVPSAKDLVPRFAEESTLGALRRTRHRRRHCGTGRKFAVWQPAGSRAGALNAGDAPWLLLALFPLCSALALNVICRPLRS
jgi:hypothetical protein